jgi:hypothetical protein
MMENTRWILQVCREVNTSLYKALMEKTIVISTGKFVAARLTTL